MEKLQNFTQEKEVFWASFDSQKKCKDYLKYLKRLGYKWSNGEEILDSEVLNFYFTLEINSSRKTVGFVPNFQRFAKRSIR